MTISYQPSTSSSSSSSSSTTSLVVSSATSSLSSLVVSNSIPSSINSTSSEEYHKRLFRKKMTCAAANIADFIKRLYRMLEDKSYANIVSWGVTGDTFVVHDPTEFAKSVLPQHFKHNNMASFVRQLNKYDFHKIKSNDDDARPYNEQAWEFQHPKFQLNRKDLLEDIKRKIPTPRNKNTPKQNGKNEQHNERNELKIHNNLQEDSDDGISTTTTTTLITSTNNVNSSSSHSPDHSPIISNHDLHSQVENLAELHADLAGHVNTLSRNCGTILEEIIGFKRNLAAQDTLLSNLYQILAHQFNNNNENHSIQQQQQQRNNNNNDNNNNNNNNVTTASSTTNPSNSVHDYNPSELTSSFIPSISSIPSIPSPIQENFLDTLIQSSTSNTTTSTGNNDDQTSSILHEMFSTGTYTTTLNLNQFTHNPTTILFSRNSISVPNWSIQPKILFIDDELSIRGDNQWFEIYGCQFDFVSDSMIAVNKLHIQAYDLIFLNAVTQNGFVGSSLAQQIRGFNTTTPIIGMTPNSNNTNNSTDYSGMNDLLQKPFTKQGLYDKIDKFCNHLKGNNSNTIQETEIRTLSSISNNLNTTTAVTPAQNTTQQQQHQINYLSAPHIDLYHQSQSASGRIHRLSDDDVDELSSINENSRKKIKF